MKCLPVMIRKRSTYQQNKTRKKPEGNFSILFVFELAHDVWRCLFSFFFLLSTLNNQENIKTPTWLCLLECDKTPPLLSQCQCRGFNCKKSNKSIGRINGAIDDGLSPFVRPYGKMPRNQTHGKWWKILTQFHLVGCHLFPFIWFCSSCGIGFVHSLHTIAAAAMENDFTPKPINPTTQSKQSL